MAKNAQAWFFLSRRGARRSIAALHAIGFAARRPDCLGGRRIARRSCGVRDKPRSQFSRFHELERQYGRSLDLEVRCEMEAVGEEGSHRQTHLVLRRMVDRRFGFDGEPFVTGPIGQAQGATLVRGEIKELSDLARIIEAEFERHQL